MARTAFGDCIGCAQPIRPPYASFKVIQVIQPPGTDAGYSEWEEVDVCSACADKLSVDDLVKLVTSEEPEDGPPNSRGGDHG